MDFKEKTTIEKIEELVRATTKPLKVDGYYYHAVTGNRIEKPHCLDDLNVMGLRGIVNFIKNSDTKTDLYVVCGYGKVIVYGSMTEYRKREVFAFADFKEPDYRYENYYDPEAFMIKLKSLFVENEAQKLLLSTIAEVKSVNELELVDDGVAQTITAKAGIQNVRFKDLPSTLKLKPRCTFPEIEQPEIEMIFRARLDTQKHISYALYRTDGELWKYDTAEKVKQYISDKAIDKARDYKIIIL